MDRPRACAAPAGRPNDITAQLRSQVQKIEIAAELIELDQLGALIPALEPMPAAGSNIECAAVAIETVIKAYAHAALDDRDRQAIDTIAGAVSHRIT